MIILIKRDFHEKTIDWCNKTEKVPKILDCRPKFVIIVQVTSIVILNIDI